MVSKNICITCKGGNPANCGRTFCPIQTKSEAMFKVQKSLNKDYYFGSSPSVFVGRHGWPNVNVGLLTPPEIKEDAWEYDAPRHWADKNYSIPQVVSYRGGLLNSRFKSSVFVNSSKMLEISQEVGMASKPVDVEVDLKKKPILKMHFGGDIMPMGPNADLAKVKITENPKIDRKVDKVVSDNDLKSNDAIQYLFKNDYDENFLTRILSVGNLGVKKRRKLVPTRWSITAVDDNLGKNLIKDIKEFNETDYQAYFGGHMGNYYLIMFFPDVWSYELFEAYLPKASWNQNDIVEFMTDHETYRGRKEYAFDTTGGYYAARLPILEKLKSMKRQSTVIALRFITNEYEVPLGVWVVREAVRKTMATKPLNFGSRELMIKYAKVVADRKFGVQIDTILKNSVILKNLNQQQKLFNYF